MVLYEFDLIAVRNTFRGKSKTRIVVYCWFTVSNRMRALIWEIQKFFLSTY